MEVVIVTGAGSGMGGACVAAVRDVADVVLAVDLRAPDVDGATGVGCDVSDADAVAGLAARVAEEGSFRALIHAAGISPTMGDARRIFEVNLVGTQLLLDAFGPLVVEGSAAVAFACAANSSLGGNVLVSVDRLSRAACGSVMAGGPPESVVVRTDRSAIQLTAHPKGSDQFRPSSKRVGNCVTRSGAGDHRDSAERHLGCDQRHTA